MEPKTSAEVPKVVKNFIFLLLHYKRRFTNTILDEITQHFENMPRKIIIYDFRDKEQMVSWSSMEWVLDSRTR